MSFIVVHELAVSPSRRAVVALYKIELASSLSMSFTSSVQNEFTINHELASQLFMSSVSVHMLAASVRNEFTINHELASSQSQTRQLALDHTSTL